MLKDTIAFQLFCVFFFLHLKGVFVLSWDLGKEGSGAKGEGKDCKTKKKGNPICDTIMRTWDYRTSKSLEGGLYGGVFSFSPLLSY